MGTAACGAPYGAGGKHEEEGDAERSCNGLTTALIPHSPAHFGVGEWEESGMKLSLEEKARGIHCPTFVHRAF